MRQVRRIVQAALAVFALAPSGASAAPEAWQALVIGQPAPTAETAFADAYHTSRALSDGGLGVVTLLRDAPYAEVSGALEALTGAERLLIYYAGPMEGGRLALRGGDMPVAAFLADLARGGTREIALLIEDCVGRDGVAAGMIPPDAPEGVALFVAASAGPDRACPKVSTRLTDRLSQAVETATAPVILQDLLADLWTKSTLTEPLTLQNAPKPARIDTTQVVSVVSNDVVALSPIMTPISASAAVVPVIQASASAGAKPEAVVIFSAPAASQIAALPRAAGLPEPSIIVGVIEGLTNASFQRAAEPGEVSSTEISYDNLVARQKLRGENPELFASLIATGAFDPPEPLLGRALQSELARMGCYNAAIDGVWGGGSRSSVERYFDEITGENAVTLEPTVDLFRQIIGKDDIVCKAPVAVAAPARAAPARAQTQARTPAPQAAQPRRTPPAAAPATRAPQGQIKSGTTMGVFR